MLNIIPDHSQSMKVIEKLLNLNSSVDENIFKKPKFVDEELEINFLIEENNLDERFKIKSDLLILLGWLAILIYIYFVFYRLIYIISCTILIFISLILTCWRYFSKNRKTKLIIDHIQVFLQIMYLNIKALYVIFYLASEKDDYDREIIRIITYNWVASTLLSIQKLDGRPFIFIIITLINFSTIIIINTYSYNNHFYYLDALSSLIVSLWAYIFKKYYDLKIRLYYGEKMKNKNISNYFIGFINGMNGFYLNIKNDQTVSYGSKMKNEMKSLNLYGNNEDNEKNITIINYLENDNDQFNFLNNCTQSDLPHKFLNALKPYDIKFLRRDESSNKFINTDNKNENLYLKINKFHNSLDSSLNFINIGIYYLKTSNEFKYYDVFYRKIILSEKNIIYDLIFCTATDLIHSLIRIEEETQNKNQILGKLVHEFKTPLNSILGLIDNMKEREEIDPALFNQDLSVIKNISNYIIFLINDIIHYSSRKNYDELNIIMHEINIRKVLVFTFEILNSLLSCNLSKYESIKTELEFEDDLYNLSVYADETRLKQILLNFISNAVKFTKSGFIIIRCFKHKEKDSIILSVADSGSGIRDENQKHIFNDFFMESEGYHNNSQGTGIGLTICKNLAKRMNMDIKFTSGLGIGTEFTIEIPINIKYSNESSLNTDQIKNNLEPDILNNNQKVKIKIHKNVNNSAFKKHLKTMRLKNYLNNSFNESLDERNYYKENHKETNENLDLYNIYNLESSKDSNNNRKININDHTKINYKPIQKISTDINQELIDYNKIIYKNQQILIVDDDKYICKSIEILLKRIFKEINCLIDIITASDGIHMIQKVIEDQNNGNKIKCIITDENMEYLNGSEAIKIIRSFEKECKIKNVKIISATSQEDIQFVNSIKNIGADLVMSKPISKSNLTQAFLDLKIID